MSRDFLLEIGCEDIPARMLPGAQTSLKELLEAELKSRGLLSRAAVQTWATPRRLVAYCKEVLPAEADRTEQEIGPPYSVAYDAAGNPTRAAQSFARKHNVPLSKLTAVKTAKGRYVAVVRHHRGRPARKVLAEVLPSLIRRISFPRSMYWTSPQEMRFIRPIRWLLALYAGEVINFELAGIKSGRFSRGHRLLANRRIAIRRASDYRAQLRRAFVLVDPEERRKKIVQEIPRALRRSPLQAREDKELLDLVVNQTECPTVLRGGFREEFLSLPSEVLVTVMRHHQKYFSVETEKGTVAPHFLTVIDLDRDRGGEIRRGHESVLEARFRDARFFWETDQRQHLAGRIELLKDIVFQARLGSYANKVERLVQLSRWLGKNANPPDGRHADIAGRHADIQTIERAASLCKADLTTLTVG
ncbi:MAG: glycine--tRNA ligase subunit beta, partial [Acidobacteria bacterium]|nr:glycine--tRNA ligase subunit beta [Acidobacteriota bacterium]